VNAAKTKLKELSDQQNTLEAQVKALEDQLDAVKAEKKGYAVFVQGFINDLQEMLDTVYKRPGRPKGSKNKDDGDEVAEVETTTVTA
jgi:DNA topoisomerase IA